MGQLTPDPTLLSISRTNMKTLNQSTEPSKINKIGLARVLESLSNDVGLMTLIGAVMYAGEFGLTETPTGYHFNLICPNARTAKALYENALSLYFHLEAVFPITRLLISTTNDPIKSIPPDYWQSMGVVPLDKSFIGFGKADNHPNWYILVKLDEDGRVIR